MKILRRIAHDKDTWRSYYVELFSCHSHQNHTRTIFRSDDE